MNNFNNIFLCIKRHCADKGIMHCDNILELLSKETKIPAAKVEFILTTLQSLELIKYLAEESTIRLTSFGKKQDRLFTDT